MRDQLDSRWNVALAEERQLNIGFSSWSRCRARSVDELCRQEVTSAAAAASGNTTQCACSLHAPRDPLSMRTTHTHTHTHTRTHARTHAQTHTHTHSAADSTGLTCDDVAVAVVVVAVSVIHIGWSDVAIRSPFCGYNTVYYRMTNYELLRWLVETPSRDFEHYHNMFTASRSPGVTSLHDHPGWHYNVTPGDVTWRSLNANVRYILRCFYV